MKLTDLFLNRFLYKNNQQNLETKDAVFDASNVIPAVVPAVAAGSAAQDINTGNVTINGDQLTPGTIPQTVLDVANWGWGQTCAFTSASSTQVNWGAGTFTSADGNSYSISSGNTGTMSAKNYIYLDLNVSTTVYQKTTNPSLAVGIGKVLIAVAQNSTSGNATFNLSEATQIIGDNILANTIDAAKITAGSITATQINSSYVYAGYISADQINAGTLTGRTVQTSTSGARLRLNGSNNRLESLYNNAVYGSLYTYGGAGQEGWSMESSTGESVITVTEGIKAIIEIVAGATSIVLDDSSNYIGVTGTLGADSLETYYALTFTNLWTYHPVSTTGSLWYESRGGNSYFVGRQSSGWVGTIDMTVF